MKFLAEWHHGKRWGEEEEEEEEEKKHHTWRKATTPCAPYDPAWEEIQAVESDRKICSFRPPFFLLLLSSSLVASCRAREVRVCVCTMESYLEPWKESSYKREREKRWSKKRKERQSGEEMMMIRERRRRKGLVFERDHLGSWREDYALLQWDPHWLRGRGKKNKDGTLITLHIRRQNQT